MRLEILEKEKKHKRKIISSDSTEISLLTPEDLKDKVLEVYIIPRENNEDIEAETDEIENSGYLN